MDAVELHDADVLDEERAIIGLLEQLYEARQAKNEAAKDDERLSGRVKQWLGLQSEGTTVTDGEHGLTASLQRRVVTTWDLRPLSAEQVEALHGLGLLTVSTSAFDALRRAAPSSMLDSIVNTRGVRQEGETLALMVKETK